MFSVTTCPKKVLMSGCEIIVKRLVNRIQSDFEFISPFFIHKFWWFGAYSGFCWHSLSKMAAP